MFSSDMYVSEIDNTCTLALEQKTGLGTTFVNALLMLCVLNRASSTRVSLGVEMRS